MRNTRPLPPVNKPAQPVAASKWQPPASSEPKSSKPVPAGGAQKITSNREDTYDDWDDDWDDDDDDVSTIDSTVS